MENKIKIKKNKEKIKIYKSLQLPKRPGVVEVAHSALDASIYRLSNVRLYFNNCIVEPQNSGPNWLLYCNIESSIVTEFSVFVTGLYRSLLCSVVTYSLSFY